MAAPAGFVLTGESVSSVPSPQPSPERLRVAAAPSSLSRRAPAAPQALRRQTTATKRHARGRSAGASARAAEDDGPKPAGVIPLAGELLFDPEARDKAAGGSYADSGSKAWDTDPVLVAARMRVRAHPAVLDACARVAALLRWEFAGAAPTMATPASVFTQDSDPDSPFHLHGAASPGDDTRLRLPRSEYARLHRVTWALLAPRAEEGAEERSLKEDWACDSARQPANEASLEAREAAVAARAVARLSGSSDAGFRPSAAAPDEPTISFAQLCEGLLELADRWTPSASAGQAVAFLSALAEAADARLAASP